MLISVISPCRNELDYIESFVHSVLKQKTAGYDLEIIIADGMSNDGTRELLDRLCSLHSNLKVISNLGLIVSCGLNDAVRAASGEIIVRMDVHTSYEIDYIAESVRSLIDSRAVCVGGPWHAGGHTKRQMAIADAFQSSLGSGAAASRRLDFNGPTDTVYLGCWWRVDLIQIGGFDESLVRNQDDELCLRFARAGHVIWQSSSIKSTYFPRTSFFALFRQFSQYGYWKVAVAKKHKMHAAIRQLLPFLFVLGLFSLSLASMLNSYFALAGVLYLLVYIGVVVFGAAFASRRKGLCFILSVAVAIVVMHLSYGVGYALGMLAFRLNFSPLMSKMTNITR